MSLTSSMEDYLEAVLVLQKQKGYARCVDVSEFLGVTKPSVSRAVKELSKKNHLFSLFHLQTALLQILFAIPYWTDRPEEIHPHS